MTSERRMGRLRIVVGIALAATLVACGSTASPYRQAALRKQTDGAPISRSASDVEQPLEVDSNADSSTTVPGAAPSRRATTNAAAPTVTAKPAANRPDGPGVTASTITIGVVHATNSAAAQAALGNTAATSGDTKGESEAVINDINAHGGVRGRRLVAIYHAVDATSTQSSDQLAQAACSDFTEDHKVLVAAGLAVPNYLACIAAAGTIATSAGLATLSDPEFAKNPFFYDMQALSTTALARNLVDELDRSKYFTGWDTNSGAPGSAPVKVGVVIPDQPQWDAVLSKVLLPALAAKGYPVAPNDVQRWHFPDSTADNSSAVAQIQASILRFRSDNVTHVLPMDTNSLGFFAQPAEAQRYRPRYGLSTNTGAQLFAGSLVPNVQLKGALGLGWSPSEDLPAAMNPENGPYSGPGLKHCLEVLKAAGFTFPDPNARTVGLIVCDEAYSIRDAINAIPTGAPIDNISFMRAVEGFGAKFPIAGLPGASFGAGKHYPVDRGYSWAFDTSCPCMKYTSGPFTLS